MNRAPLVVVLMVFLILGLGVSGTFAVSGVSAGVGGSAALGDSTRPNDSIALNESALLSGSAVAGGVDDAMVSETAAPGEGAVAENNDAAVGSNAAEGNDAVVGSSAASRDTGTAEEALAPDAALTPEPEAAPAGGLTLEQAIARAKTYFKVPEEFTEFSSSYDSNDDYNSWQLRWYPPENLAARKYGNLTVRVDASTGSILNMNIWNSADEEMRYRGMPKYSREEAKQFAVQLAKKLEPEHFKETRLDDQEDGPVRITTGERGPVTYYYSFVRVVNGIDFRSDGINVAVNADTGEIRSYSFNWTRDLAFPDPSKAMPLEQGMSTYFEKNPPELQYMRYEDETGDVKVKLVYRLSDKYIDALTGDVISEYFWLLGRDMVGGAGEAMAQKSMALDLTPAERAAVDELKGLLSRDEAQEIAFEAAGLPKGLTLSSSNLEEDYRYPDLKLWSFYWENQKKKMSARVSVNAASGELVSFNINYYSDQTRTKENAKYDQDECRKIAEAFIKKLQPEKWKEVEFSDPYEGIPIPLRTIVLGTAEFYPSYSFNYQRLNNEVPFPENGFSVTVDTMTGEVTAYSMKWWDVEFPSPEGVLDGAGAFDEIIDYNGMKLEYMELQTKQDEPAEVYLVYHLEKRSENIIDAFTGRQLDYSGKPVAEERKAQFDDIEGHPAQEDIELLAELKIISGAGGKFRPEDVITQAELVKMLVLASGQWVEEPVYAGQQPEAAGEPWYAPYYYEAKRTGIIDENVKEEPAAAVQRKDLARLMVNTRGFGEAAQIEGIYVVPAKDAAEVAPVDRGCAALALGLGILETIDGSFCPAQEVKRADAAAAIARLLRGN